jgi:pimeloyl-ACP methyl ester carboxylesterase
MKSVRSGEAEIAYEVEGSGPPLLLLHPFPVNHEFWKPVTPALVSRYRLIMPDLRGHGDSAVGEGPATMEKHAHDFLRVLDAENVGRVICAGVSIGGYALFEFWRRFRGRVAGLILSNTKASADTPEGRAGRLQSANDVLERGTEPFFEGMIQKVLGETTRRTRQDLVDGALGMMRTMSAEDVAQVQRGMAERPDSIDILKTINIPVLLITGHEDPITGPTEALAMHEQIAGSEIRVIPRAGHYAAWEQPAEAGRILRQFADKIKGA